MDKKRRRRLLAFVLILFLCLNINVPTAKAASVNVTIALSASTVSIGNNVTATISVSGSDLSAYTFYVTYTSSVLQYNSSSGSAYVGGGGGTLTLSGSGSGSVSLSFTAIANGSSYIGTSGDDAWSISEEQLSVSHAGVNVTVATPQSGGNEGGSGNGNTGGNGDTGNAGGNGNTGDSGNNSGGETGNTTEADTRSANCNLSSLQISPGLLEPSFSPSTTSYFVQLDENVTSIVVSATPEDEKASTQVSGASSLVPGENSVRITVTAENGAVKVYRLRVMVGEELGDATVTMDDMLYKFVNEENGLEVPDGYVSKLVPYKEWEVLAFESPNKKLLLVCLLDEDGNTGWYIYRQDTEEFLSYREHSANYNRYVILDLPEGVQVPGGYSETQIRIGENTYTAYQTESLNDKDLYLIYAMNVEGEEGFYFYDAKEGAFLRYVPEEVATSTDVATETEATPTYVPTPKEPKDEGFFTKQILWYMIYGAGALLVLFLFIMIHLGSKNRKLKEEVKDADEMISHLAQANGRVNHEVFDKLSLDVSDEKQKNKKKKGKKDNTDDKSTENTVQEEVTPPVTEIPTVAVDSEGEKKPEVGIMLPFSGKSEVSEPVKKKEAEKEIPENEKTEQENISAKKELESVEHEEKAQKVENEEEQKQEELSEEREKARLEEKQKNYEEHAKEAERINDRMKENYDANMDSAFADAGEEDK